MTQLLAIAAGGAAGAVLRFTMSNWVYGLLGRSFPYGTLAVNVFGSLLMGVLYILLTERINISAEWRGALLVGLLGAFTTFSTFSMETINLIEQGERIKALLNMILSVALCVGGTWLGVIIGRQL